MKRDLRLRSSQEKERERQEEEEDEQRRIREKDWVRERERELREAEIELNQRRLEERCVYPHHPSVHGCIACKQASCFLSHPLVLLQNIEVGARATAAAVASGIRKVTPERL